MKIITRVKFLITDFILWLIWFPGRVVIKMLPFSAVYFLAKLTSRLLYHVAVGKRKEIFEDLKDIFHPYYKEDEIKDITRRSLDIYVKRHFENLFIGDLTKEKTEKLVRVEGTEHIDRALKKGKGIILQASHFGSFFMILPALGFKGYPITPLAGNPKLRHHRKIHQRIFNLRVKEYASLPMKKFIHVHQTMRPVVEALKNNEILLIMLDGRDGHIWHPVRFLGKTANISPSAVRMAAATGATILPAFVIRQPDDTLKVVIEKPLDLEQCETKEKFSAANMQKIAEIFEKYIIKYPCHFGMTFHLLKDRAGKGIVDVPFFQNEGGNKK